MSRKALDLSGKRFGRLVAIEPTNEKKYSYVVWRCKCDCGCIKYATSYSLSAGTTKSCGCLHADVSRNVAKKLLKKNIFGYHDGTMDTRLNSNLIKSNTTGVRGVTITKDGKFQAQIFYKSKCYYLGRFDTLEEAKFARKEAERKIWGKDLE